jgi:hypothetical protein
MGNAAQNAMMSSLAGVVNRSTNGDRVSDRFGGSVNFDRCGSRTGRFRDADFRYVIRVDSIALQKELIGQGDGGETVSVRWRCKSKRLNLG